jgi:hypothetical protein
MDNETEDQKAARERSLALICAKLGLDVAGSMITARIGNRRVMVDASALNHENIVAALIHQAYQQGKDYERRRHECPAID